jgi:hypothetical protein
MTGIGKDRLGVSANPSCAPIIQIHYRKTS